MLCIPAPLAAALEMYLEFLREVSVADGRVLQVPYVGPLRVDLVGRCCFAGALVIGDEVVLEAVPMEDMDLIVNPARQPLEVEPQKSDPCGPPMCEVVVGRP